MTIWVIGMVFTLGLILADLNDVEEDVPWYMQLGIVFLAVVAWPLILGVGVAHLLSKDSE